MKKKAYRKKGIFIILFMSMVLFFPSSLLAHKRIKISRELNTMIHSGIDKVYRGEYMEALEVFQRIIMEDRQSPVGYFYAAAFYEVMMQNFRNRSLEEKFNFYINEAIERGENLLESYDDDEWLYFYVGGSYGYRAIDRSGTGNWFGAFKDAVKGADYLEKAIKINPRLYDAYFGLGVYKYWRSVKCRVLWFLPFFKDERQAGISEIELAINRGEYSKYEAMSALITIYRNEKDSRKALFWTEAILEKYPSELNALRTKAILYADLKRWNESCLIFDKVSERVEKSRWKCMATDLEIQYYVTFSQFHQQKNKLCVMGCMKLMQFKDQMNDHKYDTLVILKKKHCSIMPG